ncbi:sulfotransferase [Halomonas sp. 18H]|nr:sulfotransferase [Halomonas sp. 18H]MCW4152616.1 sulfotransferase [Halomonas sp. 18H]
MINLSRIKNNIIRLIAHILRLVVSINKKPVKSDEPFQPVFIIGAPRTGSTILYQALTNAYQFAYIDNTACTWHRNLRFGLWLSQKKYGNQPHNNFKAEHGNTRKYGGHAPSECGQFWYRWLPKNRHFIDHDEVNQKMVTEIQEEVLGASGFLQRPLLFKNLNAGQRLRLIHKAFPDAKIIFVRRDPRFVIRSILHARKKVGTPEGQWWSIMPRNIDELLSLPEGDMCAAQVYYLECQIEQDLALFPRGNVQQIHYQNFDQELVHHLGEWSDVAPRVNGEIPEFQKDDPKNLSSRELQELIRLAEKYPFSKELFV